MAELLSVQIHAPSMWAGATTGTSITPGMTSPGSGATAAPAVLKKVDNRTVQAAKTTDGGGPSGPAGTTLKHLPKKRPIDIEFKELTYSVSEGRKRGSMTLDQELFSYRYSSCFSYYSCCGLGDLSQKS